MCRNRHEDFIVICYISRILYLQGIIAYYYNNKYIRCWKGWSGKHCSVPPVVCRKRQVSEHITDAETHCRSARPVRQANCQCPRRGCCKKRRFRWGGCLEKRRFSEQEGSISARVEAAARKGGLVDKEVQSLPAHNNNSSWEGAR